MTSISELPSLPLLCSLVTIPEATIKSELLGSDTAKKGLLKASQGATAKVGPRKTYSVKHVDGQTMNLELQVSDSGTLRIVGCKSTMTRDNMCT